ncbi:hypothetical protein NL676_000274 [Syzygium grande]|nr:hypothetical protein NL676_000274 [Syzygium grande]
MRHWAPPTAYGVRPPPASRDYTAPPPPRYGQVENFGGMLTAFAAGAAAGVLTWLELANGVDYLVDKITDVAKKLKELLASDDDDEDASDDDAEAAEDEDAGDAYELAFEDEDAEDASEDEDDPASEIIDLAYPDGGGVGVGGDNN